MSIMGKGGSVVHSRELKRMFITEKDPKVKNDKAETYSETLKVVEDYWVVIELDEKNETLYEKRFDLDDWVEAINHFKDRSEISVNWEEDEERDLSKRYQWTMYPK